MKHNKIKELLPLYIDNGLIEEERLLLETHLKTCQECQNLLEDYQKNYNILSTVSELEVPENFLPTLMEKIKRGNPEMDNIQFEQKNSLLERARNLFRTPIKMPAGLIGVSILVVIFLFSGITGNLGFNRDPGLGQPENINYLLKDTRELEQRMVEPETGILQETPQAVQDLVKSESQRKLIQRAYLTIEVSQIENINELLSRLIETNRGYIASSRDWVSENRKYSWYQLRIPTDRFNTVIKEITELESGRVISRSITGEDVTEEYIDLETRITNFKKQEEKYRQLLERAESVEDILKVENELNRVRTNIESLEGRIKYLNNQINLSTIEVEFREIKNMGITNWGISKAFRNALQKMAGSIYSIITGVGVIFPYVILLLISYIVYQKRKHSNK